MKKTFSSTGVETQAAGGEPVCVCGHNVEAVPALELPAQGKRNNGSPVANEVVLSAGLHVPFLYNKSKQSRIA